MSTATIGGIAGVVIGAALVIVGASMRGSSSDPSVTVTNDQGQSAPVSGEGAKWILIIVGIVIAVGGIAALIKG